jgi:hypothetical protein
MEGNLTLATLTTPENQAGPLPGDEPDRPVADSIRAEPSEQASPPGPEPRPEQARTETEAEASPLLTPEEEAELARIKDLPREVGVMLLTVGALGFVLPGVVGTPAIIAGGLVLWPKAFGKVESWFERRFPEIHKQSLYQINRYLNDLESRYPNSTHQP